MNWKYICPYCHKEQYTVGGVYHEESTCHIVFSIYRGKIIHEGDYHWHTVDSEFKNYYCLECDKDLTEEQLLEGVKEWLRKNPEQMGEAVKNALDFWRKL